MFQGALLLLLMTVPLLAWAAPPVTVAAVHPASAMLLAIYAAGVIASHRLRRSPRWEPVETAQTEVDTPDPPEPGEGSVWGLAARFLGLVVVMGCAGVVIAKTAGALVDRWGISASVVGALATAVVTSLPELVTTLAAERRRALQLAMGGIIGGNTFDMPFLTASDAAYRDGSLYHAVDRSDLLWLIVGLAMTAVLTLGRLYRQREGPGGIGWESAGMLLLYIGAIAIAATG